MAGMPPLPQKQFLFALTLMLLVFIIPATVAVMTIGGSSKPDITLQVSDRAELAGTPQEYAKREICRRISDGSGDELRSNKLVSYQVLEAPKGDRTGKDRKVLVTSEMRTEECSRSDEAAIGAPPGSAELLVTFT